MKTTPRNDKSITLRDRFAMSALEALVIGRSWNGFNGNDEELMALWAKSAYALADAMLEARDERTPT